MVQVRFRIRAVMMLALTLCGYALAEPIHTRVARNIQFSNITAEAGLSAEFVNAVTQDAQGFLWFGTQDGLNRFDGHEITVYEHDFRQVDSLSDNFVWTLYLGSDGALWVGTNRGVNRYDYASDTFVRNPLQLPPALRNVRIRSLTQDKAGAFWLGTVDQGLIRVVEGGGDGLRVKHYRHDANDLASLPDDHVIVVREDSKGQLWVGTDGGGLARLDRATDTFVNYRHEPDNPGSLSGDRIRSIYEDRSGALWVGTARGGLNLYDDTLGSFRNFRHDPQDPQSLAAGQVSSIFEDAKGTLWVGTENGLSEWRPAMQGFARYRNSSSDSTSLVNDRIKAIFQDASGVLWLATYGGISSWNYFSDTFTHYESGAGFLGNDFVTSLAEANDGTLWIGTYGGGLTRLDLAGDSIHHYHHNPDDDTSLSDDRVMVVHVDASNRVWVGTRSGGLNLLQDDNGRFHRFRHDVEDLQSLSGDAITSIHTDPDGTLWVGVFGGGLNRSSAEAPGRFETFRHDPEDASTLGDDRVLVIHRERGGSLWIGTEGGGLNRFDESSGLFSRFSIVADGQHLSGSSERAAWDIVETNDGTFWIATMGEGLLRWPLHDRALGIAQFNRYRKAEGLPSTIYGVVEGVTGEIWASSNRGLFRLDPTRGSVRRFDRHNGLRGTEFNQGSRLRSRTGRLLFGANDGVVSFVPGELPKNDRPPPIVITASSRDERLTRVASRTGQTASIELGYLDPFVAFDFVALDFVSPDKAQYRYRLQGFDDEWTDAGQFRRAVFANLPAGDYRFEVQAANNDNVWNRNSPSIQVVVIPPPWLRWWAYLGYALVLLAAMAWIVRGQRRKQRRAAEHRAELERQVQQRTQELATRNTELSSLNQELSTLNDRLAEASVTDSLTGLRNRRYVDQFINTEISMVERRMKEGDIELGKDKRDSSKLLFFMMIDLDGFKTINDTFGHHAGDAALLQVKETLLECCRQSDVVVRWGGDEFMIIGHASSFAGVNVLAERVRESVAARHYDVGNGNVGRLSASIGASPFPFCHDNTEVGGWEQVSGIADQAAYIAKDNGRNAWVSIRGSGQMTPTDFARVGQHIDELVADGKLLIQTSVEGELRLQRSDDPAGIAAAG